MSHATVAHEVVAPSAVDASAVGVEADRVEAAAASPTTTPQPSSARRRTASAREAQRLRYAQGWAVRRPRTLQPRPPAPKPARRTPTDPVATETPRADAPSPDTPAPVTHDDVALFDDALCCARDRATLDEILQEFVPRLRRADREIRAQASRVLRWHRRRVADLEQSVEEVRNAGHPGAASAPETIADDVTSGSGDRP